MYRQRIRFDAAANHSNSANFQSQDLNDIYGIKKIQVKVCMEGPTVAQGWFIALLNRKRAIDFVVSETRNDCELLILELGVGWVTPQQHDNQVTLYWSGENNDWEQSLEKGGVFDIFSGFALDENVASPSYSRMPYYMLAYFDPNQCWFYPDLEDQLNRSPAQAYADWSTRQINLTFLARHLPYPRKEMIETFQRRIGGIECNGECGASGGAISELFTEVSLPNISNPSKHSFLKLSKFNLCPENSVGSGYISEKIFDALLAGTIPVYWPPPEMSNFENGVINPERVLFYRQKTTVNEVAEIFASTEVQEAFFQRPVLQKSARKTSNYICNSFVDKVIDKVLLLKKLKEYDRAHVLCGKTVKNSKSQEGQDYIVTQTFFPGVCNGTFLEVGAADGITNSNTYSLEVELGWQGILIEASPKTFAELRSRQERNNSIKINGAIGPKEEQTEFIEIIGPQSQLSVVKAFASKEHLERIEREFSLNSGEKSEVIIGIKPLTLWIKESGLTKINYLSLDVEGAEYLVLQTIDFTMVEVDVISVEVNSNGKRIHEFLASKQFRLFTTTENLDYIFCHFRICPS